MNRSSVFFDKTLYASPYMVVTVQEYTEHYYIVGERVCTKTCAERSRSIGGGFWGTAPMMPNDNALQFMQGLDDIRIMRGQIHKERLMYNGAPINSRLAPMYLISMHLPHYKEFRRLDFRSTNYMRVPKDVR